MPGKNHIAPSVTSMQPEPGNLIFVKVVEQGELVSSWNCINNPAVRVIGIFDKAVNLMVENFGLMSIIDSSLGRIPFGISLNSEDMRKIHQIVNLNKNFRLSNDFLLYSGSNLVVFNFRNTRRTVSHKKINLSVTQPEQIQGNLDHLRGYLEGLSSENGFLGFCPYLERLLANSDYCPYFFDPFLSHAWAKIYELCSAYINDKKENALDAASALIGLGQGLTPSGDDFLMGFLSALIRVCYPGQNPEMLKYLQNYLPEQIKDRTSAVSEAYLLAMLDGKLSERLENFLQTFCTAEKHDVERTAEILRNTGCTSGVEILIGCLTGFMVQSKKYMSSTMKNLSGFHIK